MRRIAFIGIEHADDAALHEALRNNLGPDAEIRVFGQEDVIDAARFLVSVNAETQSLDGSNSVAYISSTVGEQGAKRVNKLAKVGVTVRAGWSDFKVGSSDPDIRGWLSDGTWAESQAPAQPNDLFDSFFDDEDDADEVAPVAAPSAEVEDDLPAFRPTLRAETPAEDNKPAYASRSFDSMSANETAVRTAPPRREVETPAVRDSYEEDDLPAFVAPGASTRERESARPTYSAPEPEADDDAGLPAFVAPPAAPQNVAAGPTADEEDELPVFTPPRAQASQERAISSETREDAPTRRSYVREPQIEDDDVPAFTPPARSERQVAAPVVVVPDDEDDVPAFAPRATSRPEPVTRPAFSDADDDESGLPVFQPPRAAASEQVTRRSLRQTEPAPVSNEVNDDEDDEGDDLPTFVQRPAAPAQSSRRQPADEEDFGFSFTPKNQPVVEDKPARRSWEAPEQREPRVAPEQVRYEDDNPTELEQRRIRRDIENGGYEAPKPPRDTPNLALKPEPGRPADDRKPQRVVNQRPVQVEIDDDEDEVEFSVETAKTRERPVFVPPAEPTGFDDAFDPTAPAPYMSQLEPEAQRAQNTMEQIIKDYDSESIFKAKSKKQAVTFYVTGSHGGAGKTTSTWMMANTVAAALKKDPTRPVFLIEADYENSKLAQRLNMPPERNSGKLAEFFRTVSADRSTVVKQRFNMFELTEKIIQESIYVNDRGVNIIACPYDLTKRDGRFLRMAIQRSVEYAERQGGYVFIDADTLSNDDILDRTLAAKSTHVIVVSFGDQDHVEDTQRAIHTLVTPNMKSVSHNQSANGMGVPKDRIKVFFNKTGADRYADLQQVMLPYLVDGHLPTVQGLNEGGWIGNLNGGDFPNVVTSYAAFVNRISPMEELRPYQMRKPVKSTPRGGFMKVFGKR